MEGIMRRRDLSLRGIILSTHTGPYVPTPRTIAFLSLSQPRARSPYVHRGEESQPHRRPRQLWRGSGAFVKPPAGRAPRRRPAGRAPRRRQRSGEGKGRGGTPVPGPCGGGGAAGYGGGLIRYHCVPSSLPAGAGWFQPPSPANGEAATQII